MRRAVAAVAAAGLLVGLGWILGGSVRGPALDARQYGQGRLAAVQQHLDEAPAGFVFVAGDSQAELQSPAQRPCGLELVNGGIAGANAEAYADFLAGLRFPRRARAAVLAIGTNDLVAKNRPGRAENAVRFEAASERILLTLTRHADRVVVAALPPIGRALGGRLDASSVAPYWRACGLSAPDWAAESPIPTQACGTGRPASRSPARWATGCTSPPTGR